MANRSRRAETAKQTVEISKTGRYQNSANETIRLKTEIENAVRNTVHYPSRQFESVLSKRDEILSAKSFPTRFLLSNCTTLQAAEQAIAAGSHGHIACLNFASAKNPGGGFLNGSQAQEESLARASALFECIHPHQNHYNEGRSATTCLYTDSMLFSPQVPVFRNDNDELLQRPYQVSFITSAAVNAGAMARQDRNQLKRIEPTMLSRFEKILSVAIVNQVDTLVLGAWGCGVFKNQPAMIADIFHHHLVENKHLNQAFLTVHLAVLDRSKDQNIFKSFEKRFGKIAN